MRHFLARHFLAHDCTKPFSWEHRTEQNRKIIFDRESQNNIKIQKSYFEKARYKTDHNWNFDKLALTKR